MAGSYRDINYSLRPAKAIERKMLCDAFRRLHPFGKVETYRYVGFGSIYFSDFHLFHRALGIDKMLSIEKDAYAQECFEFNKPYKCVQMDFRLATAVLPDLDWTEKMVIWLDYDGKLDLAVLSDIDSVCARIGSGSVLVVTVNANTERNPDEAGRQEYNAETGLPFDIDKYRLWQLRRRLDDNVPPEVQGEDLRGKGLARFCRKLIDSRIQESLSVRNYALVQDTKVSYQQIFNFNYSDGAQMLTVGGVFCETSEKQKLEAGSFLDLHFVRTEEEAYSIEVPCLTMKEMRHLNAQLPYKPPEALNIPGVPPSDIQRYAELYRYFPTFAEAVFS